MTNRSHPIRESIACFVLLAVATVIVYGHVSLGLWQGRAPGQFDVRHYFVPMSFLYDFAIDYGELPEWNPFSFSGTPFVANPQSIVFYPPQLIRSLLTFEVTPLNTYYGLVILFALQSIGAGIGTYLLARSYKLGWTASFAAAIIFTFGVCLTRRVVALQFASTLLWIPFLMIALRRMLSARDASTRFFYASGCGLLLGISILSGFVHIHFYIALMIGVYWIASRVTGLDAPADVRSRLSLRGMARDALHLGVMFIIAACISAPMLLPAAEYAGFTNRSGERDPKLPDYETDTLPIRETMFGPLSPDAAAPERSLGYRTAGLSVYLLAFAGLLGARRKEAIALAVVFLALLDCTLGPPFPIASLIERFSPFQMVVPSRAFVVGSLPLALCAAYGVESIRTLAVNQRAKIARGGMLLIAGVVLVGVSTLPWSDRALQLTAFVGFFLIVATWVRLPIPVGAVACAVVFAESLIWNYRAIPILIDKREFINIASYTTPPDPQWLVNARVCDPAPNAHLLALTPVLNGYDPLYLRSVWNLMAPPYHIWNYERFLRAQEAVIENPRTYHVFKRPFWLTRQYVNGPLPARDRPFAPTTTAFVDTEETLLIPEVHLDALAHDWMSATVDRVSLPIQRAPQTDASQAAHSEIHIPDSTPIQRQRALSLRYTSPCTGRLQVWMTGGEPEVAIPVLTTRIAGTGSREETLTVPLADLENAQITLMFDSRIDQCEIDWRQAELLIDREDENDLITIVSRSFNSARVDVGPLNGSRLLAFLDADYPGWTARVDGEPARVLRVDSAFKGVVVSQGTHTVEFRYRSSPMRLGMVVATIALLVVCAGSLWPFIARRRSPSSSNTNAG